MLRMETKALARVRLDRLLAVNELSRLSGVASETIRRIETGGRGPRIETARRLLAGLGLEIDEARRLGLLFDDGED